MSCEKCDGGWFRADGRESVRCECNPKPSSWIVAAACRTQDGLIFVGARHWDTLMRAQAAAANFSPADNPRCDQGFIDNNRDFHTRQQAYVIAEQNDQIKQTTGSAGTLYSEDLY